MIELHQFPPVDGVNLSPFCAKVEGYLRLRRLPFRVRWDPPFKGPKGKLPFIVDDGRVIADSGDVIAHLEASRPEGALDAGLDETARATAHLVRRTLEESLYFAVVAERWRVDAGWERVRARFFAGIPAPARGLVAWGMRRKILRDLKGQGYGRHSHEEVRARGLADLAAIETLLGERDFLVAERPTTIDVTLWAFLDSVLRGGFGGPLRDAVAASPRLAGHHGRTSAAIGAAGM